MPPPGSPLWHELARFGELVRHAAVLAAVVAAGVLVVVGLWRLGHARALGTPRGGLRWRVHRAAVRAFAAAVAGGDLEGAEAMAGRALGHHHHRRGRGGPDVVSWDERVVLDGTRTDAAAQLRRAGGLVAWCPGIRRQSGDGGDLRRGDTLTVGRWHRLRFTVLSRRWLRTEGVQCSADAGGLVLVGQLTLRPIPACWPDRLDADDADRVEVWVHVEGPPGRRAGRVLRRVRRATRAGLRRWAAQQTRPRGQGRSRRFERGAGAR